MKVYDSMGRLKLNTAAVASAQPTSAQFSALSAHVEIVSARVVSVSAELASLVQIASAAATSADAHANTVSARVVSVSAELASLIQIASAAATSADAHANTASAAATSADAHANTVSARVVSVSAELASLVQIASAAATSADAHANTVSARVVSVSAELASLIQIASAAATSADAHANTASAAATSADAHANTVSARVVSVSAELASLVQIASAAATSADAHANTVSARVVSVSAELASLIQIASAAATSVDARVNSVNTFISGISARSVGGVSTHGLQSVINALSNRISATTGGGGSVTSAELASVDARVNSVNTFLSGISSRSINDISTHGVQSVIDAVSNRTGEVRFLSTAVGGGIFAITGLTISVAANSYYEIRAMMMVSVTTGQPFFMRWSAPSMSNAGGFWRGAFSVAAQGGSIANITAQYILAVFNQVNNGLNAFSITRGGTFGPVPVEMNGVFAVGSAGGPFVFKMGTSAGQSAAVLAGSFSRGVKLG